MSICAALARIDCAVLLCKPTTIDSDRTSLKRAGLWAGTLQFWDFVKVGMPLTIIGALIVALPAPLIGEDAVVHVLLKCSQHDA